MTLFAQGADDLFRGVWQIQTAEEGRLVVILKPQGLASYFWGDNAGRAVYKGSWSGEESVASVVWQDGSSHRIERSSSGFTATHLDVSGAPLYSSPATQLPQELLGQWAKSPTREDEQRSDRDKARGFWGIWEVNGDAPFYLFVEPDRSAASTSGSQDGGQRGEWAKQGSELHIIWDSGGYGILRETERGHSYKQVAPGQIIEDDETEPASASRTIKSKAPASWLAAYRAERGADTGGLAFSSRKAARAFYRGEWIVRHGESRYERIKMARFGGLSTSTDRSLKGRWTLSGQDVFMRWDDGIRKILSPVGRGFVLYEYWAARPLDGAPNRVQAAAPADRAKLTEHLKGRQDVARKIQQMAEAASANPSVHEETSRGRSFARWVWPFDGEGGSAETSDEDLAPRKDPSPWWWPFWSERPEPPADEPSTKPGAAKEGATATIEEEAPVSDEPASEAVPVELVEIQAQPGSGEPDKTGERPNEETDKEAPKPQKKGPVRGWIWPF